MRSASGALQMKVDKPHDVASMITEFYDSHTSLDVPQHTGHISGASHNLAIVQEAAAAEVSGVCAKLTSALDIVALLGMQVVDGADIVETTAGNEVSGGRISACHDPA